MSAFLNLMMFCSGTAQSGYKSISVLEMNTYHVNTMIEYIWDLGWTQTSYSLYHMLSTKYALPWFNATSSRSPFLCFHYSWKFPSVDKKSVYLCLKGTIREDNIKAKYKNLCLGLQCLINSFLIQIEAHFRTWRVSYRQRSWVPRSEDTVNSMCIACLPLSGKVMPDSLNVAKFLVTILQSKAPISIPSVGAGILHS